MIKKRYGDIDNLDLFDKEKFYNSIRSKCAKAQARWIIESKKTTWQDLYAASWEAYPKHPSSHTRAFKYLVKITLALPSPDGTISANPDFCPDNQRLAPKSFLRDI